MKLEDGKAFSLAAICRPSQWPGCWWDAKGLPIKRAYDSFVDFDGDAPAGLWAIVNVVGPNEENKLQIPVERPNVFPGKFERVESVVVSGATAHIDAGVPVGPWKQVADLQLNQSSTIDGVTYLLHKLYRYGDGEFRIELQRTGSPDGQDCIVAVTDKKEAMPEPSYVWQIAFDRDAGRLLWSSLNGGNLVYREISPEAVKSYRLMRRKRQWVSFDGFAMEPTVRPPDSVAPAEMASSDKIVHERDYREKLKQLADERARWAEVAPDPTNPAGATRLLGNEVAGGDEAAARKMVKTVHPERQALLDQMVHDMVRLESCRQKLVTLFGEVEVREKLVEKGLVRDMRMELLGTVWNIQPDGSATEGNGDSRLCKDSDGKYVVDFDSTKNFPQIVAWIQRTTKRRERLEQVLSESKAPTIEEVETAMRQ